LKVPGVQFNPWQSSFAKPKRIGEINVDILNTLLAANVVLTACAFLGFALTKEGVTERVGNIFSNINVAGIAGAAFGLVTVSSVGAMFL
jgi:hypothetical protein